MPLFIVNKCMKLLVLFLKEQVVVVKFIRHYRNSTIAMKIQNYTKCQGVPKQILELRVFNQGAPYGRFSTTRRTLNFVSAWCEHKCNI